jgi:uncharacterized membrane protein YtjA (UPF0391 family)
MRAPAHAGGKTFPPMEPGAGPDVLTVQADTQRLAMEALMLGWALAFLIIALIAAALGFGGIAGASAGIAQILFFIFLVLFVIALVARAMRGRPPV